MPELEAWEKVLIAGSYGQQFLDDTHGQISCQGCHGGASDETFATKEEAHSGMVGDPSTSGACDTCHSSIVSATANSLHTNLWGEKHLIEARGNCSFEGDIEAGFNMKCNGCHTTCGQCHVSRPNSVGGGFIVVDGVNSSGHKFRKTPHMTEQCTACHGSRIGTDYFGSLEGNERDVHYASHLMQCADCHSAEEIHGDDQHTGDHYNHRYEVATMPRCENCHEDVAEENDYHDMHWGTEGLDLQCQVCHSQPYKNCTSCHPENGSSPPFTIDPSVVALKIGKHHLDNRDYDYSVLRHIPVDTETYEIFGLTDLPNFDDLPTWKYSSPHNILRWTEQTTVEDGAGCGSNCHDSDYYLREADLYDEFGTPLPDYNANLPYVID